jgi:hypothetical protein
MPPEAQTVLHTWCRQSDWNAPTIVGGARTAHQVNPTAHRVAARGNLILLAPPLVIGEHDLADALDLLDRLPGSLARAIRTGKQP